jgi:murein DD-endopeptidase MepM/ murein hydrolase activator NlpD
VRSLGKRVNLNRFRGFESPTLRQDNLVSDRPDYFVNMNHSTFKRKIIEMEELRKIADSPIWNQGDTKGIYNFPLPQDRDFMEDGKRLAIGNPEDETYIIGPYYAATSPQSHIGPYKWAIDFLVPDGTEVLAAEDGVIVEVIDGNFAWGDSEEFRD